MKRPVNFRDIGGIKTEDGRVIAKRRLLRSGELVGLCGRDKVELMRHGLKTVVDFRTSAEVAENPDETISGVKVLRIDLMDAMAEYAPGTGTEKRVADVAGVHQFMKGVYEQMLLDKTAQAKMAWFLRVARGRREGALLFHCFAGKDRTGIAAAILLTLLNVGKEAIRADYLVTNEMRREANREMWEQGAAAGVPESELVVLNEFLLVHDFYLDHMYKVAEERNGSLLEFIKANMRVTDGDIEELQENYLATI